MAGHKEHIDIHDSYTFSSKQKKNALVVGAIGILFFILGVIIQSTGFSLAPEHSEAHGEEHAGMHQAGHDNGEHHAEETHAGDNHKAGAHEEKADAGDASHGAQEAGTGHGENDHAGGGHGDDHAHAGHGHHGPTWVNRLFANLWFNNIFFTGIAVVAIFFIAFNYVAYAGWHITVKRIPEAIAPMLYVTAPLMLIFYFTGKGYLFHWTHEGIMDPEAANYDAIIASKSWWLNEPFFVARMVVYLALWILIYNVLRRFSLKEDLEGGTAIYNKAVWWSALFLVVFGVTSSTSAWDWIMSIDTHWFSTLFGWYVFASWFVSGLAVITLVVLFLKDQGHLKMVNQNHLHDLGKFMFAFSIFWTYLWFAQFLLYYYSNIPEEVVYYRQRMWSWDMKYFGVFITLLVVNFIFPFLVMMTRGSKRHAIVLKICAFAILGGHWLDFYLLVMPGTNQDQTGFGFLEFGTLMIFVSILMYVVGTFLSKANLVPKQDPMLEESLHHHV